MRRTPVILSLIGALVVAIGLFFISSSGSNASDMLQEEAHFVPDVLIDDSETITYQIETPDAPTTVAQLPPPQQEDTACIDCHSDAEQLQLVAEEEVVVESLNEGSG